jgi:hypothetical protein
MIGVWLFGLGFWLWAAVYYWVGDEATFTEAVFPRLFIAGLCVFGLAHEMTKRK